MSGNGASGGGGGNRESQSVNQYSQAARQREEKARQRELAAVKGGGSVVEKERQEFKELKKKNTAKTVNTITTKSKPIKYASIGKSQMRMGRSGTVVTSGGLLVNKNMKIKKKKLLGE